MIRVVRRSIPVNLAIGAGICMLGYVAYKHPIRFSSLQPAGDGFQIGGVITSRITDISTVHDGEGNLKSEWPAGTVFPKDISFRIARATYPGQGIVAEIVQAVTPDCERSGADGTACPTIVSAVIGGNAAISRSYEIDTCLIGSVSTMTLSGNENPSLTCGYAIDSDGIPH